MHEMVYTLVVAGNDNYDFVAALKAVLAEIESKTNNPTVAERGIIRQDTGMCQFVASWDSFTMISD